MIQILISSSVLILVLVALRKLLQGKISLRLQYALWLIVAVRLLVPVQFGAVSFSLSSISEKPEQAVQTLMQQPIGTAQTAPAEQPVQNVQTQQNTPAQTQNVPAQTQNVQNDTQAPSAAAPQTEQPVALEAESSAADGVTVGQVLKIIWLVGVGITAIWFVLVNAAFRRKALRGAKAVETEDCPLPVYVSEHILSPCLLGSLRPRILLTKQAVQDERTMRHVLAHETTHYRHGDHIWALVRAICLCAYWFDPLVWWAASLSLRDCELACDEGAIKRLGEEERLPYGKTLLGMIANAGRARNLLQTATTMARSKKQIRERVEMIVKKPKKLIIAVVCLLLVLGVTVGCTFTGGKEIADDLNMTPDVVQDESTVPSENPPETQEKTEPQVVEYWKSADGAFRIPQLELEGDYAAQINAEILKQYSVEAMQNGEPVGYASVDYTWAINGDILSLSVVGVPEAYYDTICLVCNIDVNTGAEVPIEEIYGYVGLGIWEYQSKVGLEQSKILAKQLRQILLDAPDTVFDAHLREVCGKTVDYENITQAKPWLDENGDLWCCGTVYNMLGGESTNHLMCLTRDTDAEMTVVQTQEIETRVIELYTDTSSEYVDADGNAEVRHIPFLMAPGSYANTVNAKILMVFFRESMYRVEYSWAINGDILSLAVLGRSDTDAVNRCYATNINIKTGDEVSYDTVYGSLGLSYMDYLELVKKALINQFVTPFESNPLPDSMIEQMDDYIARTANEGNLRSATPYLDSEGKLWIRGTVYQFAGAESNEYLLPLTDYELSPNYNYFQE
ncbi:MAG: M56 family metallopeptidase [Faecousia sp.]